MHTLARCICLLAIVCAPMPSFAQTTQTTSVRSGATVNAPSLPTSKPPAKPSVLVVVAAQTTVFTYQGRLTDAGAPASGTYQMQFALFDAATGGNQIGSTMTFDGAGSSPAAVSVANGVFTVQLDFGAAAFPGADRFLEISVKKSAEAEYTTLAPRQQITSTPYAIQSLNAYSANSLSAACAGCVTDAQINAVDGAKVTGSVASATTANVAGNVSGVVGVANGGTGSATQNFVDLTTNQTIGGNKTFTGILSGDGSGLRNLATGVMPWTVVSGASVQAQSNHSYALTNDAAQGVVTLPASPSVGDFVRVTGVGAGGWRISMNPGQFVGPPVSPFDRWTPHESDRQWISVASSSDGTKLVALEYTGKIYTSIDSGVTWTPRESDRRWVAVASSSDGTKLVAVASAERDELGNLVNGRIYTSTDSGATWTPRESDRQWQSVASSSDGTKLVAAEFQGQIYTSTDSGVTWTPHESEGNRLWASVASSADGTKLVAVVLSGQIYTSTDSGATWTPRESDRNWISVASSSDGTKLVALEYTGKIYTSIDSGVTWTPRESDRQWAKVASSSDGTKLVAIVGGGQIYISTDSGVTWTPHESDRQWTSVASSADGTKLVAVVFQGKIYTTSPEGGPPGYLTGGQNATIELLYVGGGRFAIAISQGTISSF